MNNLKAERTLTSKNRVSDERLESLRKWYATYPGWKHDNLSNLEIASMVSEIQHLRSQSLSTQQPMGEVRVKPLEWLPEKYGDHVLGWRSVSSVIRYFVEDMGSGCGEWRYWLQRGDHVIAKCASEEEAKAAAQSNYDTTILYALHPNQESDK